MQVEYKRDLNHNYLIVQGDSAIDTTSYQVRMVLAGQMPMLLPCRIQALDGRALLYYEITSRQSLASYYENKKLDEGDLRAIFQGFMEIVQHLRAFLLEPDQLLLSPEYIFLDVSSGQLFFCCLPGYSMEIIRQFCSLVEYLLPKINHQDCAAVALGYGVYRCAIREGFQMEDLKKELFHIQEQEAKSMREQEVDPGIQQNVGITKTDTVREEDERIAESQEFQKLFSIKKQEKGKSSRWQIGGMGIFLAIISILIYMRWKGELLWLTLPVLLGGILVISGGGILLWKIIGKKSSKGNQKAAQEPASEQEVKMDNVDVGLKKELSKAEEGGVESEEWLWDPEMNAKSSVDVEELKAEESGRDQTVVLCTRKEPQVSALVSKAPGQLPTIVLDKDLVIVGKLEIAVDTVIPIPTVSRIHAKIKRQEEEFYLTDLNSKNGTFVNGRLLAGEESLQLKEEDQISFADAEYIFIK